MNIIVVTATFNKALEGMISDEQFIEKYGADIHELAKHGFNKSKSHLHITYLYDGFDFEVSDEDFMENYFKSYCLRLQTKEGLKVSVAFRYEFDDIEIAKVCIGFLFDTAKGGTV